MNRVFGSLLPVLTILGAGSLPCTASAQALSVFGGDQQAEQCYQNAEYAALNTPIVHRSLLDPCNYALELGTLSLADRAATYANRGIILAAHEDIDNAMQDYRKAMKLRPASAEIFVNRGNAYFLDRNYAMALEDYEQSVALGIQKLHFVRYNMGMAYEKLGNVGAAESHYREALALELGWELAQGKLDRLLQRQAETEQQAASE